jgi:hypothetical protein
MKIKDSQIVYSIECLPETTPLEGNVLASGNDAEDKAAEDGVRQQLEAGNEWAWCTVKVTAEIPGTEFKGVDYLGCCSYKSLENFIECNDYYADMKAEAKADLIG